MSLVNDIMYPFGNPELDKLKTRYKLIALNNVLKLARERVWLAEGKPIDNDSFMFDEDMLESDVANAKRSLEMVQSMLDYLRDTDSNK